MDRKPLPLFDILRKKLHWLEGFGAAIRSKKLNDFIESFRRDLNKFEKEYTEIEDNAANRQ